MFRKKLNLRLQSRKDCFVCKSAMIFQPGCCGNLPLWRCPSCGQIVKWKENESNANQYLKLK